MGMHNWIPGLVWGGACILVVTVAMAAGVAIPRLHPLFADERVTSVSASQLAQQGAHRGPRWAPSCWRRSCSAGC